MFAPRFFMPIDDNLGGITRAQERLKDLRTRRAATLGWESKQASFESRKRLFAEAMLENSPTRPRRRLGDFAVSLTAQILFLAALLLPPLYFSQALGILQFSKTRLAAPPPAPGPPPPPTSARAAGPKRRVMSASGKLVAPRAMPRQIARLSEVPDGNDLAAFIVPGEGVPGGIPGGQPGVVIDGIPSSTAPPTPIASAPKGPIRVSGAVKSPRLIFGPEPVYPILARQARIGGAVAIDAVIDTQGSVAAMRIVSGQQIYVLAAVEALRNWKYEPTTLGGEAIPVRLLLTMTFDWKGHRE